jgi:hypothetical protein
VLNAHTETQTSSVAGIAERTVGPFAHLPCSRAKHHAPGSSDTLYGTESAMVVFGLIISFQRDSLRTASLNVRYAEGGAQP